MQIVSRINKKHLELELENRMPKLFFERELRAELDKLQEQYAFSDSTLYRLLSEAKSINLKWNQRSHGRLLTFDPNDQEIDVLKNEEIDVLDIVEAWSRQPNSYLSHQSALYFHDLVEQRPKDFFISKEIKSKTSQTITNLNEYKIRQAFLKPARNTQNYFEYAKSKFYLLEKGNIDNVGVISKSLRQKGQTSQLKITSVERTFIDCVISPHYAGGLPLIFSAFKDVSFNLDQLFKIYDRINPIYPYWQNIGFILESLLKGKEAVSWRRHYSHLTMIPFYLAHEAKSHWQFSEKWNVFYPQGLTNEIDN